MIALDLRSVASALGGEVSRNQVLAPGPGHSHRDRSMSVLLSPGSPVGFIAHSFAGTSWPDLRDYICSRLGLEIPTKPLHPRVATDNRAWEGCRRAPAPRPAEHASDPEKIAQALALWREGVDPRGTIVEFYLNRRGLALDDVIARHVIRWHGRIGAMLGLFRSITTGEPRAVGRTYLTPDGGKIARKFLGRVGGAAVMLDGFDEVAGGLHVGEGVETCLSGRQLGLRPTWALGSAGAVAAFPVMGGVECLTILAENDDASAGATEACAIRWYTAGREVIINRSIIGKDLNDAIGAAV